MIAESIVYSLRNGNSGSLDSLQHGPKPPQIDQYKRRNPLKNKGFTKVFTVFFSIGHFQMILFIIVSETGTQRAKIASNGPKMDENGPEMTPRACS